MLSDGDFETSATTRRRVVMRKRIEDLLGLIETFSKWRDRERHSLTLTPMSPAHCSPTRSRMGHRFRQEALHIWVGCRRRPVFSGDKGFAQACLLDLIQNASPLLAPVHLELSARRAAGVLLRRDNDWESLPSTTLISGNSTVEMPPHRVRTRACLTSASVVTHVDESG